MDELADRVGDFLLSWPAEVRPAILIWTRSDDRWLRRASIICQLGTRDQTDPKLLTVTIEAAIGDSDFFLRKASDGRCGTTREPTRRGCGPSPKPTT